jgi:hypothetical protein
MHEDDGDRFDTVGLACSIAGRQAAMSSRRSTPPSARTRSSTSITRS